MSDPQRNLFNTEPEAWEVDDQSEQLVATVVLTTGPAQEFDYLVPDGLRDRLEPGRRVRGPIDARRRREKGEGDCFRALDHATKRVRGVDVGR